MKIIFSDFLNEAKASELYVGARVLIKGNVRYNPTNQMIKLYNYGICTKIEERRWDTDYHFKLDEPILNENIFNIYLDSYQLRNVHIVNEKTDKFEKGELALYKASSRFNWVLKGIKFKREEKLMNMTDFDLDEDHIDMISYIPVKKNSENIKRQHARVGKVLKVLSPSLSTKDIEDAVNKFRALADSYFRQPVIKIVNGSDISKWYSNKNYQKGGGTLNNSCMRFKHSQSAVKFYDKFPDQIALAILVKDDKLWARALIWKFDSGQIYMDRIYSVNAESGLHLLRYAKEHNMLTYRIIRGNTFKEKVTLKNGTAIAKGSDYPFFDSANIDIKPFSVQKDIVLQFKF